MRWLALVPLLACQTDHDSCSPEGGTCSDTSLVCSRDGECLDSSELRSVKVTWTVAGAPPTAQSCANVGDFELTFIDPIEQDQFGYAPVPCMEGQFSIDKIPSRFTYAEINAELEPIGSDGSVSFAL